MSLKELLNINPIQQIQSLLTIPKITHNEELVDEYGFILRTEESMIERRRRTHGRLGSNYNCQGYCKHLPHADSRRISFKKNGLYYCSRCEIAMGCSRCRCCGCLGRMEPRQRTRLNNPNTKFIE